MLPCAAMLAFLESPNFFLRPAFLQGPYIRDACNGDEGG